ELDYKGVYFLEESRRSYPKGSLASQIIGFAGIDNQGLNGIELQYDDTLLGSSGKFLLEYDGAGNEIPQATENYIPSEPGCDIYLTLDETIQYIIERELKKVVQEQDAPQATAIVMDVKTGAVLGMANYPDYDPNDYGSADSSLWSNFAVNGLYEPGSTFKILTTAMVLEERVTNVNEGFYCAGYQYIGKLKMSCHKKIGHGAESFTQGVANSCNPVFVEVSRRLGMSKFYDYLKGFGMTEPTGIDLPGEADSLIVPEKSAVPYDLAAMSIGQANAFTPIQMITAISAVANGGKLMKPYIVDKIEDPDGNLVKQTEPEVVRQVISEDTAREVWAVLETVVSSGTGKQGQIEGYKVAGKTGTAEKVSAGGGYSSARVVSFAGFAPAENPQIACLVIVDDPIDAHGGATAGPVFQKIMEDSLRYLEVPKDVTITPTEAIEEVAVPAMPDNNPMNAIEAIKAVGLTPIVETQGEVLYTFVPAEGTKVQKSGNVYLYCGPAEGTQVVMPSLYGRTIKEVDRILSGLGLSGTMNGSGLCVGQSIEAGQVIEKGTALIVDFGTTVPDTTETIVGQEENLTEDNTTTDIEDSAESTTNSATVDSQQVEETEPIWD
ncbi:MAG: penicillin-binding transpeptidase domain-containing protein, partial [Peptococcaceae bacterium]